LQEVHLAMGCPFHMKRKKDLDEFLYNWYHAIYPSREKKQLGLFREESNPDDSP